MWTCPICSRKFAKLNQFHICVKKDIGELFLDKSDEMVLAFDRIMTSVMEWTPNDMGAAKHSVVFTSKKAWLIIKPMKVELDLKFYFPEKLESDWIKKYQKYPNKWAHHIRIANEDQVDPDLIALLQKGFEYSVS